MTQSDDETCRKAVTGFAWEMRTPLASLKGHSTLLAHYLQALKMRKIPSINVEALGNVELSVDDALDMIQAIEQTIQGLFALMNETLDDQNNG